jgi:hypothetical protein
MNFHNIYNVQIININVKSFFKKIVKKIKNSLKISQKLAAYIGVEPTFSEVSVSFTITNGRTSRD